MAGEAVIGALRVVIGADSAALDKGLDKARGNVAGFGSEIEKAGATINGAMSRIAGSLGIDIGPMSKSFTAANDNLLKLGSGAEKIGFLAGTAIAGLAVAAVAAGAAIAKGLGQAIDRAEELNAAAQKFGVPIEQLSALKFVAEQSEVSFESLGVGLKKLSVNMSEAAGGSTNDATRAFEALGIKVVDSEGKLKTTSQVLGELADKFQTMEEGAGKTALAVAIFGKSGSDLIPLLNEGSAGIAKMTDEARQLGLVISAETGVAADQFNDNMAKLGKVFEGFSNQLLPALLPSLVQLSDMLVEDAKETQSFKVVVDGLVEGFNGIVKVGIGVIATLNAIGLSLNAVNAAMQMIGQLNFSGALETLRGGFAGVSAAVADAQARISAFGMPEANPFANPATMQTISDSINFKLTAPIIKSTEATKAATAATDEWGRKLDAASVKKRAMDLIVGAQEPWQQFGTAIKKADADLVAFGATGEQIGAVHKQIAEKYNNTWAQVAPSVAGSFQQIGQAFEKEGTGMARFAKIAGIAQATTSMLVGAAKALELPFPANLAASAAVLAMGASLVAQVSALGGFAEGGSFRVAGPGGRDNMRAMVDVSPGEQVDIWRPGDGRDQRGGVSPQEISISVQGEVFGQKTIRKLVEQLNEAYGNGARLRFAS